MKLDQMINSLLPSFGRNQLTEDIRLTREEINTHTLPAFKTARELTRRTRLTSDFTVKFDEKAKKRVDNYKDYFIPTIDNALQRCATNLDSLIELAQKEFEGEDIMRDAMTIAQSHIIQYVQVSRFIASYARRLLLVAMNLETNVLGEDFAKSISRDIEYLTRNEEAFMRGLNVVSTRKGELKKHFEKVPDILLTPESVENTKATVGAARTDPFKFGLIYYRWNPIYHLRMAVVNYQVNQAKLAQEELESLELKMLHLKQRRDGKEDAKLERSIQYTQQRIDKLRYKLHKLEEDA